MRRRRTVLGPVTTRVGVLVKVAQAFAFAAPIWFASGTASAIVLNWSVTGGRFADGGIFSGTFGPERGPQAVDLEPECRRRRLGLSGPQLHAG